MLTVTPDDSRADVLVVGGDAAVGHAAFDLLRFCVSVHLVAGYCRGLLDGRYEGDGVDIASDARAPSARAAAPWKR